MALPQQNSHIVLFLWFSVQLKSTLHTYMHACLWINWNFEHLTCIVPKYPVVLKVPNIFSMLNKKQRGGGKRDWSFRYVCVYFILCAYLNFRKVFCALCCGLFGTRQDWHWSRLFATPTAPCIVHISNSFQHHAPVMAKYPLGRKQNFIGELVAENHQVWLKHLVTPIYTWKYFKHNFSSTHIR